MIYIKHLTFQTTSPKIHFFDITEDVKEFVRENNVKNGIVVF